MTYQKSLLRQAIENDIANNSITPEERAIISARL